MDELAALQELGLVLPSPAYIVGVVVFSVIGMVAYYRGRKAGLPRMRWLGLALMLYPYVVSNTVAMYGVGVLLCAGLLLDRR
jgi:hypothetical protein